MPSWSSLRTAYGTAENVPALLAAAKARPDDRDVWFELWSNLCHQGTVYSASYAAVPALAELAELAEPSSFCEPLYMAAMIVASESREGSAAAVDVRGDYAAELSRMRELAEHNLQLATDIQDVAYAAHCLAALEGIPVWQDQLDRLGNGETDLDCPTCDESFIVDLDEAGPAEPTRIDAGSARVLEMLAGRPDVSAAFLRFAGTTTCPRCGATISIPEALS